MTITYWMFTKAALLADSQAYRDIHNATARVLDGLPSTVCKPEVNNSDTFRVG
jgi:hypothetical protein